MCSFLNWPPSPVFVNWKILTVHVEPHALKINGVSFSCTKSFQELGIWAITTARSGLFSLTHPLPARKGEDMLSQGQVFCSIPLKHQRLPECVHLSVFCGARAETMWGLLLLRRMCSSFTQSAQAAGLSSCPTLSLSQPESPEGRSRMLFQLSMRRPVDQYEACWSGSEIKSTDGLGGKIVPNFPTKTSGYCHCFGKFYTVYARYLYLFTL